MCKFLPTHCLVKMGVETPKGKLIVWCINVLGFWILNNFLMILFLKKEFYYVSTFTSRTKQILGICLTLNGSNWIFLHLYIQNTYLLLEFIINMFSSKTLTLKHFEATILIIDFNTNHFQRQFSADMFFVHTFGRALVTHMQILKRSLIIKDNPN